jgi:hypothetical protein
MPSSTSIYSPPLLQAANPPGWDNPYQLELFPDGYGYIIPAPPRPVVSPGMFLSSFQLIYGVVKNFQFRSLIPSDLPAHIVTAGGLPGVGSLASGVTSASIIGKDSAGQVTLNGSVSVVAGKVCTVTFAKPFISAPIVVCSVDSTNTTLTVAAYPANITANGFDLYLAGLSGVVSSVVVNFIVAGSPN